MTSSADRRDIVVQESRKAVRLYQQVAEKLVKAISTGQYAVGTRLPAERELAIGYAVSRPTIREAIIALEIDGLVEVKMGSGVYVRSIPEVGASPAMMDVGAFELTEARILIEGETAALAASLITDQEIQALEKLLVAMGADNLGGRSEAVDREFHQAIADATHNSALAGIVDSLWTLRESSPQCASVFQKSRARGVVPVVKEHRAIVDALRAHDSSAARAAMQGHLKRVLSYLLDATENETIKEAKAKVAAQRNRFMVTTQVKPR
jgi:GntR family hexuronate regulon transcriptional repressor